MKRSSKRTDFPAAIVLSAVAVFATSLYLSLQFPTLSDETVLANNLGLFLLINLNVVVILILGFLVVKNLVKLILDRRRNILGSKLRARLVGTFVLLSAVPTILLFVTATGLLEKVMHAWFSPQVTSSVETALELAKYRYDFMSQQLSASARQISEQLANSVDLQAEESQSEIKTNVESVIQTVVSDAFDSNKISGVSIYIKPNNNSLLTSLEQKGANFQHLEKEHPDLLEKAFQGHTITQPLIAENGEVLQHYLPLPDGKAVIVVSKLVPKELSESLKNIIAAYDGYTELNRYHRPLESSYFLTLVIVLLLIVFAAIWIGFYLARSLTGPIQELAQGTLEVSQGNLEYRIPEVSDDELGVLVNSFNLMTTDLKRSNEELNARRKYMETVLGSIGIGVVSVGEGNRIALCNQATSKILMLEDCLSTIGLPLEDVIPTGAKEKFIELLDSLRSTSEKVVSTHMFFFYKGNGKNLQVTVSKLDEDNNSQPGFVILIDDLSELVSAQRMAAWREVARRIAHEIKNPLTPIKLGAQRLQRRYLNNQENSSNNDLADLSERKLIKETTEVIVEQVEILKTLVNEFSQFARMPKLKPVITNINDLVSGVAALYIDSNPDINIILKLDSFLPEMIADGEQMNRVLVNLMENAVASINEKQKKLLRGSIKDSISDAQICLETRFNKRLEMISIEVSDSGLGIATADSNRLFEPYYTTKKGGTGLGLSIVSSIVADHNGFIRVRESELGGARFVIEMPVHRWEIANVV